MDDEVEDGLPELAQVGHVSLGRRQWQTFAVCDRPVLPQLVRGVVEHGDVRPDGRQERPLLPAAGGEAEDIGPF